MDKSEKPVKEKMVVKDPMLKAMSNHPNVFVRRVAKMLNKVEEKYLPSTIVALKESLN